MRYYLKSAALPAEHAVTFSEDSSPLDGVYTRIVRNEWSDAMIWQFFGRRGCCLKVFKRPYNGDLGSFTWEASSVVEATIVQNLAWRAGLAPRVYGLVQLASAEEQGLRWLSQVTDFVEGTHGYSKSLRQALSDFRDRFDLHTTWDMNEKNGKGGLWLEWGRWSFAGPEAYQRQLEREARENAAWGSRSEPYQSPFGGPAQRRFSERLSKMGLEKKHVAYRNVLDIGCNLGNFLRWAEEHGARRACGIELPHVANVAMAIANWCRAWNTDIYGLKLRKNTDESAAIRRVTGVQGFDVVLALSVDRQVGYGSWMRSLVRPGGSFWLEGHVPDKRATYEERLKKDWGEVEFLGMTRDHGPRPLFRCRRNANDN